MLLLLKNQAPRRFATPPIHAAHCDRPCTCVQSRVSRNTREERERAGATYNATTGVATIIGIHYREAAIKWNALPLSVRRLLPSLFTVVRACTQACARALRSRSGRSSGRGGGVKRGEDIRCTARAGPFANNGRGRKSAARWISRGTGGGGRGEDLARRGGVHNGTRARGECVTRGASRAVEEDGGGVGASARKTSTTSHRRASAFVTDVDAIAVVVLPSTSARHLGSSSRSLERCWSRSSALTAIG